MHSILHRLIDPRRPLNRKITNEEAETFLTTYEPVIPLPPLRTISHTAHVSNIQSILTSPTFLESTSLVLGFGQSDLFLTRVSPSGRFDVLSEVFNKVQLILTILGLGVGIMVSRVMVKRKMLHEKWYY